MIKKYILGSLLGLIGLFNISLGYYCNSDNTYCNDLLFGETLENVGGQAGYIGAVSDNNLNFKAYYFSYRKQGVELFNLWWEQSNLGYAMQGNGYIPRNGKFNNYVVCSSMPSENDKFILNKNGCSSYTVGDTMKFKLIDNNRYLFRCNDTSMDPVSCYVCSYKEGGNEYICLDNTLGYSIVNTFLTGGQVLTLAKRNPYSDNGYNNIRSGGIDVNNARNNNNNIYCPTIKQLMNNYGENYNTGLCYNSTLKYENGQIQTVEKKDIFTVFENYQEYSNRLSIYQNQCTNPNTQQNCESAFSGKREKYSIIANIRNGGVDKKNIWNYCNLGLNYDPNATTCVASGYVAEPPTSEDIIDNIRENGITLLNKPGTGNIFNSLLGSGENREDLNIYDIIGNFTQIKDKVGSLFKERKGTNGIIPDYILWIIMLTLLLTVLFKK